MELPSQATATIIKDLATALALVVGGLWAFWRWSLGEYLRKLREMPSFEGELSARVLSSDDGQVILTASCKWKNVGVIPLNVNTQETRFTVCEIPAGTALGPIGPRLGNLSVKFILKPWQHWSSAILEAGTNSELHAHFLVEPDRTYVIACRLEAIQRPKKDKQVWVRELIWSTKRVDVASINAAPS
jgi:hypothetical protein